MGVHTLFQESAPIWRIATGKRRGLRVILPEEERPTEPYVVATLDQVIVLLGQGHLYQDGVHVVARGGMARAA
jgi:hypothetical protein